MRNLAFLATETEQCAARTFRYAFMEQTASWSVSLKSVSSIEEARIVLEGRFHAIVAAPRFRALLFEHGASHAASCGLSQGADVWSAFPGQGMAFSQAARCAIDAVEEAVIPLYGANVAIVGSGSAGLDFAYECARAGVESVTVLDARKERAENNLTALVDAFRLKRGDLVDTEAARVGHVSARKAYDQCAFKFASLSTVSRIEAADVVIVSDPRAVPEDRAKIWPLRSAQIVCDPWSEPSGAVLSRASACRCDIVGFSDVMRTWGAECARLLTCICSENS